MKIYISKKFKFEAAHFLPEHEGHCKDLHGHSYTGEVVISCDSDNLVNGMVADYGALKALIDEVIVGWLDHKFLNDHFENPTAENMVRVFFTALTARIKSDEEWKKVRLQKVSLSETVNSNAYVIAEPLNF